MRVAIDARTMQVRPPGGIGRGLSNLLPRLRQHVDIVLLTNRGAPQPDTDVHQVPLRTPVPSVSATWLQLSAPAWLRRFDGVFHCPFYALPAWLPVPGVVTLHDLTFEHARHLFSRCRGVSFRTQARHAARVAACLLTPSEHVRQDVIETYQVNPDKVLVASNGIDPVFRPDADPGPALERMGVTRPFIVALGGAPRRNLPLAIEAWAASGSDHDLVVVGSEEPAPRRGLHWAGQADDKTWAGLLARASAFLYPTSYEGYGMPGIEALAAGTPVVATQAGALPEVLGPGAAWAASLEVEDLSASLRALLSDESHRLAIRAAGLAHAETAPGWDASAQAHLRAYAMAVEHVQS